MWLLQKKEHCFLVHEIVLENTGKLTSYAANVSFSQTFFPRVKKILKDNKHRRLQNLTKQWGGK